jgi:hypothetical protein
MIAHLQIHFNFFKYNPASEVREYSYGYILCSGNVFAEQLPSNVKGRTHRQQGDFISLFLFFKKKEGGIKFVYNILRNDFYMKSDENLFND